MWTQSSWRVISFVFWRNEEGFLLWKVGVLTVIRALVEVKLGLMQILRHINPVLLALHHDSVLLFYYLLLSSRNWLVFLLFWLLLFSNGKVLNLMYILEFYRLSEVGRSRQSFWNYAHSNLASWRSDRTTSSKLIDKTFVWPFQHHASCKFLLFGKEILDRTCHTVMAWWLELDLISCQDLRMQVCLEGVTEDCSIRLSSWGPNAYLSLWICNFGHYSFK
jgi:hypothetical protein